MDVPKDWLPCLTWQEFFYRQQLEFVASESWQTWFIGGNGTGKTLIVYWSDVMFMLGLHPNALAPQSVKVKCLVPSFDNVEDVALEKLLEPQRIVFPLPLSRDQNTWIQLLEENKALQDFVPDTGEGVGYLEVGPLLPKSMIKSRRGYTKEHKGIELNNGSSIWFATSEQGWQAQRGGEQDVLSVDEEPDERVFDECLRGLRNAKKGGKVIAGLTPPYQAGQGPTWTKEKVLEASVDSQDISVIRSCMADNPAITDIFIKRFSEGKSPKQVQVQVYGNYPTWGDLVHEDFEDEFWDEKKCKGHILPNSTPIPDPFDVDWVMAFDWHPSKATAAIWGWVDRDGNIVFFDELDKDWAEGKEIDELANAFFQIEGEPHMRRKFRRWQDPSARTTYKAIKREWNAWDAFRKYGIVTAPAKNRDPEVGIDIVNRYLRGNLVDHPRVFFFERMKYTRQYMGNHYWKRSEDRPKGKPDEKWSDYPVCVKYILQELGTKYSDKPKKKWPLRSYHTRQPQRRTIDLGAYT